MFRDRTRKKTDTTLLDLEETSVSMTTVASPAGKPDVDPMYLRPLELAVDAAAVNATLPGI